MKSSNELLRQLPKVDECIAKLQDSGELDVPVVLMKAAVQETIDGQRKQILAGSEDYQLPSDQQWLTLFQDALGNKVRSKFRRVINGTGVVIHTNLGRSVLSERTMANLAKAGGYYTNLEFDLNTGKRGSRYSLVEEIICQITGCEAALVVNNNAAAVLIALDTLAKGKEVIVSRGQLVEIGGSFRIPDVMAKSGARLIEVGATNRTHLKDYQGAITEETAMLLKVHTSNFRLIGFTKEVSAVEMVELARKNGLITMEDLGSGSLVDLSPFGLPKEPTVQEIVQAGVDVVTFSGDKLLGGPQAGIIVGKRDAIARIKKNPLNRALRIDKFTLVGLESVLREYYDLSRALQNVPTLSMLTVPVDVLKKRAQKLKRMLGSRIGDSCELNLVEVMSRVGGGAMPECNLESWALELNPSKMRLSQLERGLRELELPVIGRIENEKFILDMRTIQDREIGELVSLLQAFFTEGN